MLKRKENKKECRKSQLLVVGSLLILVGISILGIKIYSNFNQDKLEDTALEQFYEKQEIIDNIDSNEEMEETTPDIVSESRSSVNYVAVIKIPKIGIERGLSAKGSYYNNVNRNIEILKESTMPDEDKGNVILAGHSGNGRTAFFRNLYKLTLDDNVSILYNGKEYKYKVVNSYEIEKTGEANIVRNAEKSTVTLITCKHNTNKQIVVVGELVEII